MTNDIVDLLSQDIGQDVEDLPDGNALGSFSTFSSASTTGSTAGSASTAGCLG